MFYLHVGVTYLIVSLPHEGGHRSLACHFICFLEKQFAFKLKSSLIIIIHQTSHHLLVHVGLFDIYVICPMVLASTFQNQLLSIYHEEQFYRKSSICVLKTSRVCVQDERERERERKRDREGNRQDFTIYQRNKG